jgi:hypothetical protein
MKKIFLILIGSVLLGACTKAPGATTSNAGTTVDYEFSAPTNASYVIVYTDSTGYGNAAYITMGTKWSKVFHPITPAGFKTLLLVTASTVPTYVNPIGNLKIIVNGSTKAETTYNFATSPGTASAQLSFILP